MTVRFDRPWHSRPFAPSPGDRLCDAAAIGAGDARAFTYGEGKTAFELILVGTADGPRAYINQCPHFKIRMTARPNVAAEFRRPDPVRLALCLLPAD